MNKPFFILTFWKSHPALFYGLALLLGFYAALDGTLWLAFPLFLMWVPYAFAPSLNEIKPLILSVLIFIAAGSYAHFHYHFPTLPPEGIEGDAHIDIESVSPQTTYFGQKWVYRCRLNQFIPDGLDESLARNIKCSIEVYSKSQRPLATHSYVVHGTLRQTPNNHYYLKVPKKGVWYQVINSWSLAEWRFKIKQWATRWIKRSYEHENSGRFLAGLMTGDFDDRLMQIEFSRFGLQHIMAISGFHFAILAGILSFWLRIWLPGKLCAIGVLILLSTYFFLLGGSPSVLRAWTMILIVLIGYCIEKQPSALNSLGVALIGTLLIDPLFSLSLGFQFSFLVTAGILLGFGPVDAYLCSVLNKRKLSEVVEMNVWNQHAYCMLSFFRQGLALTIATNLVSWPLVLYYFKQFPVMSLFYNFFFPLFVSLSMFLLLAGLIIYGIVPLVGQWIHQINNQYTKWTLNLVYNMPSSFDVHFGIEELERVWVMIYTCLVLTLGIWLYFIKQRTKSDIA